LEPLGVISMKLASVVGPEPADVIESAGRYLVVEIEAATHHPVEH
jgi:hypothetical protein